METKNKHFSIWLIYNLVKLAFWGISTVSIIVIIIAFLQSFGILSKSIPMGIQLPNRFDVLEQGSLILSNTKTSVSVTNASGNIQFENIPRSISIFITLGVIPLLCGIIFSLGLFKNFLARVLKGTIFHIQNIRLLKRISYTILGIWVYIKLIVALFNIFIAHQFVFETVRFEYTTGSFGIFLWLSLFIWVLSHIFEKGLQIEEENKLTI